MLRKRWVALSVAAIVLVLAVASFMIGYFYLQSSQSRFEIKAYNGEVTFAEGSLNGAKIQKATLENDTWTLQLNLNDMAYSTLGVSAQNCTVNITHFDFYTGSEINGWLNYTVSGGGKQVFQTYYLSSSINVTAYFDGTPRKTGAGWILGNDGKLTVFNATSNVSIHFAKGSAIAFTGADSFLIPNYNGSVSFADGGSYPYGNAILDNDTWNFNQLGLNSYTLNLTALGRADTKGMAYGADVALWLPTDGYLSVSAVSSRVNVTSLDPLVWLNWNGPHAGWLNYTVVGAGSQRFNLFYFSHGIPLNYTVYVNGVIEQRNNVWAHRDGWLTVAGAFGNVSIHYEEGTANVFTPFDAFPIPGRNATVNFGKSGGYDEAVFANNLWNFTGLTWNVSESDLDALSVTASNCNMNITDYSTQYWGSGGPGAKIDYNVTGVGTQTFSLNRGGHLDDDTLNWSVSIDGQSRGQNDGWAISSDGSWVTVTGASQSVHVSFYRQMPVP